MDEFIAFIFLCGRMSTRESLKNVCGAAKASVIAPALLPSIHVNKTNLFEPQCRKEHAAN
jgi:hypothetical protein